MLTNSERLLKTIHLEEPDRVPHFENSIHPKVREAILPGGSFEDFIDFMDLDAMVLVDKRSSWKYETVDEAKNIRRNQWGALVRFTSEETGIPIEPVLSQRRNLIITYHLTLNYPGDMSD